MKTIEIKQRSHHYIETAQRKKLKAIYTILEDEIKDVYDFWDDENFVSELKRREKAYRDGSVQGYSIEESVLRAKKAIKENDNR